MGTKVLKVGVTGGIGSGKSLVCSIFKLLGAPIYDADARARWITNFHPDVKKEIKEAFGKQSYLNEKLDNRYLAGIVFKDKIKTDLLNRIVHPRVGEDFSNWVEANKEAPYLIKEAALMYESDSYKSLDKVIVVAAPLETRISRVLQRDPQRSEAEIKAIIDKQMPEEEKLKRADFIVYNDDKQLLISQLEALDKIFREGF